MAQKRPIKVLLAKVGLDGHDRAINVITSGLRDEGMEVTYTGLHQTPEQVVTRALEENVDVLGLSSLSGGYNIYFREITRLMGEKGMDNVLIIAGGIIAEEDIPPLLEKGISAIFGPGTPIKEITDYIRSNVKL